MNALVDQCDSVLFDLDGVIYRGADALPGVVPTIDELNRRGIPCRYVTNNASRSAAMVADHLRGIGIACSDADVVTSPEAAVDIAREFLEPGSPVFVVGGAGIDDAVRAGGLTPTRDPRDAPRAVIQGIGPTVTWQDLADAAYLIEGGCSWIATNLDLTLPTGEGIAPGNGSLVAAVANAVGRPPDHVAGKPEPALLRAAMRRAGSHRPIMVGDRLDTDALGAHRVGIPCLFVATGIHSLVDVCTAAKDERPTYLGRDISALLAPAADGAGVTVVRRGTDLHWDPGLAQERAWDVATAMAAACWAQADRGEHVDVAEVVRRWTAEFPKALPYAA